MVFDAMFAGGPIPAIDRHCETHPFDAAPDWTVVMPFFNERDYLSASLASLAQQTERLRIVLVDNASTDDGVHVARHACERLNLDHMIVTESTPGKVAALACGLSRVSTRFVATCDADTYYPPHYLAQARRLLESPGCAVAGAYYVPHGAGPVRRLLGAAHILLAAGLFPQLCHTGGAGQAFVTASLRRAGGFDPRRWNLVLEDHEIIHRTGTLGAMRYHAALHCSPARRKRDRASVKWTPFEQLVYTARGGHRGDWFFYDFLGPRLDVRSLSSKALRERDQLPGGSRDAAPYPVRR